LRLLLCEVDTVKARGLERALGSRFDLRVVATLADAERELEGTDWRPELIVTTAELPDGRGAVTLERLSLLAGTTPILLSSGVAHDILRRQIESIARAGSRERQDSLTVLRTVIQQQQLVHQSIATSRAQILAELERMADGAAEVAVSRAVEKLMARLGLDDAEGVRLAVRLARAWEAAKAKFVSALATGIASAFLLALGAGFVALLKGGSSK
jgi:DNA-binding NarL/FixJ family response regulator